MISYKKDLDKIEDEDKNLDLTFGSRYFKENIPKYSLMKMVCLQNLCIN